MLPSLLLAAGGLVSGHCLLTGEPFLLAAAVMRSPESSIEVAMAAIPAMEQALYTQINQYRTSQGLPPLHLDTGLSEQARQHSQAIATGQVPLGHTGFELRVQAISARIPFQGAAENVASNFGHSNPVQQAVESWLQSSNHRHNIEGHYNLTGIGIAQNAKGEYYFTQIFVLSR